MPRSRMRSLPAKVSSNNLSGKDYKFGGPSVKDEKLFGVGTGMGLRKEDNELREALNKAFAEMRADGTYEKLAKKYFDFDVYGG